jgi:hypothetical protein
LSPSQIRQLRDELDAAENSFDRMVYTSNFCGPMGSDIPDDVQAQVHAEEDGIRNRFRLACDAYRSAIEQRRDYLTFKAENSNTVLTDREGFQLKLRWWSADHDLNEVWAARPEYATMREVIDAGSAARLAKELYDIAETKFQDRQRQARFDKKHNIVRR